MIKELREKFKNNEQFKFSEKFTIISDFYSKDGELLEYANDAYSQSIKVAYDVVMISNSDNSFQTSVLSTPFNTNKFSKIVEISHADEISDALEKITSNKLTELSIELDGPSDSVTITQHLMLKLFANFNVVNVDVGEIGNNKVYLPDGEFKLTGFNISGGTIVLPQKFSISTKEQSSLSNANCFCELSDDPVIQVIGKNVVLTRLSFTQPVKLTTGATYQTNSSDFTNTSVDISYIDFNLNGFDDRSNSKYGIYKIPLISVESNNYTSVFDINLVGGSYRKLISFSGVKEVSVNRINRSSNSINAFSIGLDSVRLTKISNVVAYGEIVSENKTKIIKIDTSKTTLLDTISVNNIRLHNCGLMSLDSLGIKQVSVHNCDFDGESFITSKNNNTTKFIISNSRLSLDSELNIEGNDIQYIDSTIITDKKPIKICGKNSISIVKTKISCGTEDLSFKLDNNCYLTIKNSELYSKNFIVDKAEDDVSPLNQFINSSSEKKIKIADSILCLGGAFTVKNIDDHFYDSMRFSNVSEITIVDASTLSSQLLVLDVEKSVPIKFNKVNFKNSSFVSGKSPAMMSMEVVDCFGDLSFYVNDINTESRSSCDINISSIRSKLGYTIGSKSFKVRAKITSSESLGSCFFGGTNVSVIPEIKSVDVESFERVKSFTKKYDKVCYGNV